jgi:hypothetical protein
LYALQPREVATDDQFAAVDIVTGPEDRVRLADHGRKLTVTSSKNGRHAAGRSNTRLSDTSTWRNANP